jgi:glutamyl-tRNA synthetase/glutamyl-Q tRNA(Asp) synthetase
LHLGHVLNAIYVWETAQREGGAVLLRIEDHDRQRSRPEYERAIHEDLAWLGFVPDQGPVRQSEREERYREVVEQLRAQGLVYACSCSRRELTPEGGTQMGEAVRYDGRCRERNLDWSPGRGLRVRLEDRVEEFDDLVLGHQAQNPARQCGDLLIRDRLGNWTYQFAVTVDDWDQGITHVIRGEDLLSSTGRQIALGRLIGRRHPPAYLHHPLLRKADGAKLSKSNRDTGVRELRDAGLSPAEVIAKAERAGGR